MDLLSILFIAVGLAMDSFAVSITSGVILNKFKNVNALIIALFMGGFQALMPFLGWLLGYSFKDLICNYDHWIAFFILLFLGSKMIWDGLAEKEKDTFNPLKWTVLLGLAIATSIDALAVGVSFAFLNVNVYLSCMLIGSITFLLSYLAVYLGCVLGKRITFRFEIVGGIILIIIGSKILIEHIL